MLIDGDQVVATKMDAEYRMKVMAEHIKIDCEALLAGDYTKAQPIADMAVTMQKLASIHTICQSFLPE